MPYKITKNYIGKFYKNPTEEWTILFEISKNYWELKCFQKGNKRKYEYELGNLSDAEWYWHEKDAETFGLYLYRIAKSEILDEFLSNPTIQKYSDMILNDFKHYLITNPKTIKWIIYGITGDNNEWTHNGKIAYEIMIQPIYSEEQWENYYYDGHHDFEEFYKWYKRKKEKNIISIKNQLLNFNTLSDLLYYMHNIRYENLYQLIEEYIQDMIGLPENYNKNI